MQKPTIKLPTLALTISLIITIVVTVLLFVSDEVDGWRIPPISFLVFAALYGTFKNENKPKRTNQGSKRD